MNPSVKLLLVVSVFLNIAVILARPGEKSKPVTENPPGLSTTEGNPPAKAVEGSSSHVASLKASSQSKESSSASTEDNQSTTPEAEPEPESEASPPKSKTRSLNSENLQAVQYGGNSKEKNGGGRGGDGHGHGPRPTGIPPSSPATTAASS